MIILLQPVRCLYKTARKPTKAVFFFRCETTKKFCILLFSIVVPRNSMHEKVRTRCVTHLVFLCKIGM